MSIRKKYLKTKPICKVTFKIPKKESRGAKIINIVGDFNDWDISATPMKSLKNGTFEATVDLEPNKEYQFRYLMDGNHWENDWAADKYVPTEFGDSDNSVVVI